MQTGVIGIVTAAVIFALAGAHPAVARVAGLYEVTGVEKDDMLKMRAGLRHRLTSDAFTSEAG